MLSMAKWRFSEKYLVTSTFGHCACERVIERAIVFGHPTPTHALHMDHDAYSELFELSYPYS